MRPSGNRFLVFMLGVAVILLTVRPCWAQEAVLAVLVPACASAVQAEANGKPQEAADRRCQEAVTRYVTSLPKLPDADTVQQITATTDAVRAALVANCSPRQRCQEIVDRRYAEAKAKWEAMGGGSLVSLILSGTMATAAQGTTVPQPPPNSKIPQPPPASVDWPSGLESAVKRLLATKFLSEQRDTLRGLPGLDVVVEGLTTEAEKDGLRGSDIQTEVELQLRLAGIRVLPKDAMPYVYVNVNTVKGSDGLYAYALRVEVKQSVRLGLGPTWSADRPASEDGDQIAHAVTWAVGSVGRIGAAKLREVRDQVKDDVNKLINDWLTVNPKK